MCGPSGMLSFTVAPFTRQLVSAVHLKPLTNRYDILGRSWSLSISRTLEILIEYSKSIENASFPWRWKSPSRILRILFSHNRACRQYKKLLGDKLKYTRSLINLQSAESVATQSTGGTRRSVLWDDKAATKSTTNEDRLIRPVLFYGPMTQEGATDLRWRMRNRC